MKDELIILGSPLGPKSQADLLEKKINELEKGKGIVEKLDAHYGFFMLKNCFSLPKLFYFLRTSISSWVGGNRAKERDRNSQLVLRSTYQIFEWDRNNSDRNFYNVVRYVHIPLVP